MCHFGTLRSKGTVPPKKTGPATTISSSSPELKTTRWLYARPTAPAPMPLRTTSSHGESSLTARLTFLNGYCQIPGGEETLLLYQARMRRTWHEELKIWHCFNISKIDEDFLERCRREVMAAPSVLHSSPTLEVGPTAPFQSGRPRSQKSNRVDSTPPRSHRHHPYQCGSPGPSNAFHGGAQDQAQGLCAVCLRESHENMTECRRPRLGDGKPACSYRNGRGQLVNEYGNVLCDDFQRPEGCAGGCRAPRHRCSGCGKSQHGAADCPRRTNAHKNLIPAPIEDVL
ncbi:hypothetical protein F5888DRAFT_587386 [Russula emetica]|nr:hypothetical protein F5888DRAFT_587386 [Russula emetica]